MQGSLAFALSGLFHAAASYAVDKKFESAFTAFGIFAIQPVGLLVQLLAQQGLKIARFPRGVSDMLTAVLGFGWLVFTANVLADTSAFECVLQTLSRTPSPFGSLGYQIW
jgi:hypothetical protein